MSPDPGADVEVHRRFLAQPGAPSDSNDRRRTLRNLIHQVEPLLADHDVDHMVDRVDARISGLGPLAPLLADLSVSDVLVNGAGPVWVERDGQLERTDIVVDAPTVTHLIERIVGPLGRRVDRSSPVVDARLADGSRVHAVVEPVAIDGPCLTIRRFSVRAIELTDFCESGTAAYLAAAVHNRANIVVSGGTGAGKTTLLNALAAELPTSERVITIEDAAELRLPGDHIVRLETVPSNGITTRTLVRNALRMRPDRIVVGECRGGEAYDMLQAMNTGHDGSLSTLHANTPADALRRLEAMVLLDQSALPLRAVREFIESAVDLVVQVQRGSGKRREVQEVAAVIGGRERLRRVDCSTEDFRR